MRKILLAVMLLMIASIGQIQAQQKTVKGTVISNADNQPIPGANIQIKGTTIGAITDIDGTFSIDIPGNESVLLVSYIGYLSKEVLVGNQSTFNILLEEDVKQLGEVIVVGYGEQDRKTLTSSISSVSSKDIQNLPMASPDQMMQGRAAGVQVNSSSGTPGGGMFIRVRGSTSINASSDPLYVVDGIPIVSNNQSAVGLGGQITNPLADINPADIESMEILKDASATAIYGARAANGVVLITTKRGAVQKAKIEISSYVGIQSLWRQPDVVDGPTFERLINEARINNGQTPIYANPDAALNTDWMAQIFQDAPIKNFDASITGGTEKVKYLVSLNQFDQDGITKPSNFNRTSGRVNLDFAATDKLNIGTSILISRNFRNRVRNDNNIFGAIGAAYFLPTNEPIFQPDGSYTKFSIFENPKAAVDEVDIGMLTNRILANIYADYEIAPGLIFRSTWSLDYNNVKEDIYDNTLLNTGAATNGNANSIVTINDNWIWENVLSYQKNFGTDHSFNALLGYSAQNSYFERTRASGQQFPSNDFRRIASAAVQTSSSEGSGWGIEGIFGRVNYAYKEKYLATVNIRRDASSRFGAANQAAVFPSVAVGWVLTEENFMANQSFFSTLKPRASWGITGNQTGIGDFQARGLWGGGANYTDFPGTAPNQLANPDLKWETTTQTNVGIDIGILNDRFTFTFDYYDKQTKDLLLAVPLPRSTGFNSLVQNFGEMENKGFEVGINGILINKKDFSWDFGFNISQNRNLVKRISAPFNVFTRDLIRVQEGFPLFSFWLNEQVRVDPETGLSIYRTVNGEAAVNSPDFNSGRDRFIVGNAQPDFFGGLNSNLRFKNFDFNMFWQYTVGNDQLNWVRFFQEHGGTRNTGFVSSQLRRWQQPGDITDVPRMISANYRGDLRPDRFLEDGSYLRLKNLSLGYTLPSTISEKIGFSRIRVYGSGQNLLTITNYTGLDPEVNTGADLGGLAEGIDLYAMPQPRVIMGGLNLTFK
ncbi:TonB-linked outer membrane protein, SusC/RagA family [Belliella baltica DSM 15883]|uniref:TonB-linked outer membrane protein, SusC/RagA family n=1 Tax=Belliella baltica (strain DSM 15883 / CIP 108006 / LMG 21964 / BA134) TaxID=866536 RepID=I3ZAN7_BELBD|nr:TonB-dependent receptor [Belliella baltica]AFL86305.1 TonB-linked outer membrane protein, SusC/RagA family [Belliella baltica DSM 15883]